MLAFSMSPTESPATPIAALEVLGRAKQKFLDLSGLVLDGRGIRVGANAWQVRSFGQTIEQQHRWMHVALLGRPFYTVVLKMSLLSQADDAMQALRWWLACPGHENGDVIEIG